MEGGSYPSAFPNIGQNCCKYEGEVGRQVVGADFGGWKKNYVNLITYMLKHYILLSGMSIEKVGKIISYSAIVNVVRMSE